MDSDVSSPACEVPHLQEVHLPLTNRTSESPACYVNGLADADGPTLTRAACASGPAVAAEPVELPPRVLEEVLHQRERAFRRGRAG